MIEIVPAVLVSYEGNDADFHVIEAQAFGHSMVGAAKLYNAVAHYCAFGFVPTGNYKKEFHCYAAQPKPGSYEIALYVAAIAHEWVMHAPLYKAGLKLLFAYVLKAVKDQWTQKSNMAEIVEIMAQALIQQAQINADLNTVLANGLIKSNDNTASLHSRLIDTLPALAEATRNHGYGLVAPIGNTCRSVRQLSGTPSEFIIEEADADVIRGGPEMEVDDMKQFKCTAITEVNVNTGHCIVSVEGFDAPLAGKISDPAIATPGNVYTKSLDHQTPFQITAKPVKRDGVVKKLYISDAREIA